MAYDDVLTSAQLTAAMNAPERMNEIFKHAVAESAVMTLGRRLPNLSRKARDMSVLDVLPVVFFEGETNGVPDPKQTTEVAWKGKRLTAANLAVIIPIPEDLLEDTAESDNIDLESEILPLVGEAMGRAVDTAVIAGINIPSTWMTNTSGVASSILAACLATNHFVTVGAGGGDLYDDMAGPNGIWSMVERDGYMVNGALMDPSFMGSLRGVRADSGAGLPIFSRALNGDYSLMGERVMVQRNGASSADAPLIVGDWSQLVYAVRKEITVKLLTESVITDPGNNNVILHNLAQQDMVALRVTFRLAVQIANAVTPQNTSEATRYPFGILVNPGS